MLTSWQLAASGPGWSVLLKPSLTLRVLVISYPLAFVGSSNIILSNKLRTDHGIWSLLTSLKWLRNQETWVLCVWLHSNRPLANMGNDMKKYSLHWIFTFYFNRDTVLELFPVVVFEKRIGSYIITHPVNFDIQREIAKNMPRSWCIAITLSIMDMDFLYRLATLKSCSYINLSCVPYCENMLTGTQHFRYALFQILTFPEW